MKPQDICPKCDSENIANEGPENDDGSLDVTCHDCGEQWTEEQDLANAQLIALAPEMLDKLVEIANAKFDLNDPDFIAEIKALVNRAQGLK